MNLSETDKKQGKILIGIAGAGILLYFIFKSKSLKEPSDPTGNNGYIPATPVFSAKNIADTLYESMNKWGTDTDVIMEVLKTVTQSQFAQVVEAFGKLNYNVYTGDQTAYPIGSLPKYTLKQWLKEELSAKDYAVLKLKYPYAL